MSSENVRDAFFTFIRAKFPTEVFVDISGEIEELADLLAEAGVPERKPWIGVDFVAADEVPMTVPATNTSGTYREVGTIQLHICDVAQLQINKKILPRATALINCLRGRRIGSIVVERIVPPNFSAGTTLEFDGGYTSAAVMIEYYSDINL